MTDPVVGRLWLRKIRFEVRKASGNAPNRRQICIINLFALSRRSFLNALLKDLVVVFLTLHDRSAAPLSQFVIAAEQMDLLRKLAFHGTEQIEHLMRFVPATRITIFSVNDLLKNQMSPGMCRQVCLLSKNLEVPDVTVNVARHENIFRFE